MDSLKSFHSRALAAAVTSAVALGVWAYSQSGGGGGGGGGGGQTTVLSDADAARFLTQASYGPTDADISTVKAQGVAGWIAQQEATSQGKSSLQYMRDQLKALWNNNPQAGVYLEQAEQAYWMQALTGNDQLRERMKLALSEIFVTSFQFSSVDPIGMGSYWDMLGDNAFGNFRTLMEKVTYHPQMARYLTSLQNQKENPATGKTPDENYAREIMQLMTIGLWQLNQDGTRKLDASGNPIPTYTHDDIAGLARVFTGLSFYDPHPSPSSFLWPLDANAEVVPLIMYNDYHSTSQKIFLGTTIPASTTANGNADIKIALDTIFNHSNVGPFIATQLIKRFVTSNPTPGYVSRVASVFNDNGSGVRGDLGAVIKAVLTDDEARNPSNSPPETYGKLREPLVRLANWARAFGAKSQSGLFQINYVPGKYTDQAESLSQRALYAPSVFNFWRPGYVPSNSKLGTAKMTAPEFQVVDEVSVAGYANTMQQIIDSGVGYVQPPGSPPDVVSDYHQEVALATDPPSLVARLNLLLTYGTMSEGLKQTVINAVNTVTMPPPTATATQIQTAKLNRVKLAIYMVMISPEYLTQR